MQTPPPLPQWSIQHPPQPAPVELAGPAAPAERIESLDVLRGFAVLGILVMNIQAFAMIEAAYYNPTAYGDLGGANYWVWLLSHVFADGKFITTFSMLFGAGIVLMAARQEQRGLSAAGTHYRRMGVLLVIGLLHAHLLWYGDILYTYALCGMVVYLCRNWPPAVLIGIGLAALALNWILWTLLELTLPWWPAEALEEVMLAFHPTPQMIAEEIAAYRGGWLEQLTHRVPTALEIQTWGFAMYLLWWTSGLMLIGMALFKLGIFSATRSSRLYGMMLAAAVAGAAVLFVSASNALWRADRSDPTLFPTGQWNYWLAPLVALGWIGLVMLLVRHSLLRRLQQRLAAVGRTALSNYLLQTLICTTIFYGHGFGLFGQVQRIGQIGIVAAIWVVQLILSPLWLRRFRYGPVEWLWRGLTYRRLPPMRRDAAATTG